MMCIGKYVMSLYNKIPYQGILVDAQGTKIRVSCMKQTGSKKANIITWSRVNKIKIGIQSTVLWESFLSKACQRHLL